MTTLTLDQKAVELLDKLDQLATQYSPEVMDSALAAVQVTALDTILTGLAILTMAVIIFILTNHSLSKIKKNYKTEKEGNLSTNSEDNWELAISSITILKWGLPGLLVVFAFGPLLDLWVWVSIFNPKLGLAHQILGL